MRFTSSLRSCQPSVYHTKMGESRSAPFPMAQVNLPACSQRCPFNAERQAGEAVNTNFKVIGLTRLGIKTQSTALEADTFTTRLSELLIGTCYNFTINVVQCRFETIANRLVVTEICGQYVALNQ